MNLCEAIALELNLPVDEVASMGIEASDFGILTSDDMDAIKDYFVRTEAKTPEATQIKDEYTKWYDGLYWYEKTSQSNFDLARNLRNRFNLANETTKEAKAVVQNTIETGLTKEQLEGEPDRRLSDGMLPGPTKAPKPPLIPTPYKIAAGVVVGVSIVAASYGAAKG